MNAKKQSSPDHPIHDLIARRWSPYGFDDRTVSGDDCLVEGNQGWAAAVPVLGLGQHRPSWVEDRRMVQARRPRGWRRPAQALPSIQSNAMVVATCRHERRLRAESLRHLEAENAAVESQRPFKVGDLQMDVADADLRIDRARRVK